MALVQTFTLNRPHRGNSYDGKTAREITAFLNTLPPDASRFILRANGKNFCTGADLEWMARGPTLSLDENIAEMNDIYLMYEAFLSLTIPVVSVIQGKVRGGGLGLVAVSDFATASPDADFYLPEKSLGLVPGIIGPILLRKIGRTGVDRLEASPVSAEEALRMNLIQKIGAFDESLSVKKVWKKDEILLQEMKTQLALSAEKRMSFIYSGSRK